MIEEAVQNVCVSELSAADAADETMPASYAILRSSPGECTPNLANAFARCIFTVESSMPSDFIGGVLQYAVDHFALARGKPVKAPADFVRGCVVGLG